MLIAKAHDGRVRNVNVDIGQRIADKGIRCATSAQGKNGLMMLFEQIARAINRDKIASKLLKRMLLSGKCGIHVRIIMLSTMTGKNYLVAKSGQ
jgi:hypothetical protein